MSSYLHAEIYLMSALICALILIWLGRNRIKSATDGMYKNMLLMLGLSFLCGIALALPLNSPTFKIIIKSMEIMVFCVGIYYFCGYCETLMGKDSFDIKGRRILTLIPLDIALIAVIINLFKPFMFKFDEGGCVHLIGEYLLYAYLLICQAPFAIRLAIAAKRESEPNSRLNRYLTAALCLITLLKLVLIRIEDQIPITAPLMAIMLLCVYMGVLRYQVSLDALTQVNNRRNLLSFMNYKLKNRAGDMCLMMIDIDDFKRINDTYGHLEGDRALTITASALKRACGPFPKRPYIARYGGDEFIIVMDGDERQAEQLKHSICEQLGNAKIGHDDASLGISIGISLYNSEYDARAWIASADKKLYSMKPAKAHSH